MHKSSISFYSLGLLLALSLGLNLYGIQWGLPNGVEDWANDSLAPLGPLVYAKRTLSHEFWSSKYPPVHFMTLALVYVPYILYLYLTGGLTTPSDVYPYGLADPATSLMILTLIARVTSAVMGTATVWVTYITVNRLYGHRAGWCAAFLLAASYAVIYYSHNANIDVPQLFWTSLALYNLVVLRQTYATRHYVGLGIFSALAIGTKDSMLALVAGLGLALLYCHFRHEREAGHRVLTTLVHRKLLYGVIAFAVTLILALNLPWHWEGFAEHVEHHLDASVKGHIIAGPPARAKHGDVSRLLDCVVYLMQTSGLPAFLLGLGGVGYCLIKRPATGWPLLLLPVSYYLFFLRIHATVHLRYLLPVYLLLTWPAGKLAADLLDAKGVVKWLATALLVLIFGYTLVYGFSVNWLMIHDSRYTAETWMARHIPSQAVIVAVGPAYGLSRFPVGLHVHHVHVRLLEEQGRKQFQQQLQALQPDYVMLNVSHPVRVQHKTTLYQWLRNQGYDIVTSFQSAIPFWGAAHFHAVNPELVIFARCLRRNDSLPGPVGSSTAYRRTCAEPSF